MIGDRIVLQKIHYRKTNKIIPLILNSYFCKKFVISIGGESGTGKCFGIDTKIIMSNGSLKSIQNIVVGDEVITPNSKKSKVIMTHNGFAKLYKVTQKNGNNYIVNGEHILSLKKRNEKKIELPKIDGKRKQEVTNLGDTIENISVNDYLKKYNHLKNPKVNGYKTSFIEWGKQDVDIESYFLGLWLGDGRSNSQPICKPDKEVYDYLYDYADRLDYSLSTHIDKRNSIVGKKRKNKILDGLRKYDLLNNKHIPHEYKINNREIRFNLLGGLIDSDGNRDGAGGYSFSNMNETLIDDVVFLARSLGLAASKKIKKGKYKGEEHLSWRVNIWGDTHLIPIKIKRKKCGIRKINKDPLKCGISVEYIGEGEYFGIEIDDKDKLFLLEDFTVVHNTEISTLVQDDLWVKHRIRCKIIHIDDYYFTPWQERNKIRKKAGIKSVGICEIDWDILRKVIKEFRSKKRFLKVQRIHKYTNSIEYCNALNKNIDILIIEGLYANHLIEKNLGFFLEGSISDTKKFREFRGKEKQNVFRERVLKKERQEVIKTKKMSNFYIPF